MSLAWIQGDVREAAPEELPSLTGPAVGLFETILVRDGAPLLLEAHLERLTSSAHAFGDLTPPDSNELAAACRTLPGQCKLSRARMRITLVPGQCAVTLEPFTGYAPSLYRDGAAAALAEAPGHPLGEDAGLKRLPYTPLLEAREAAKSHGAIDVVFHTRDGALLEASASNVFVVLSGVILTPPLTRGILPGVVRAAVLQIARELGLAAREADVFLHDIPAADEAFLTGSLMEVMPLSRLGPVALRPGPLARRLRETLAGG